MTDNNKYKLAVLAPHPIENQGPLFKYLANQPEIDLIVYFCSDYGIKPTYDYDFQSFVKWDFPILEGYKHKFLNRWGRINPGIILEVIKHRLDAILVLGWGHPTNWLAFITAFVFGTPVFLRGESSLKQELLQDGFRKLFKKIILSMLFKKITAFLYIGNENKDFYKYYNIPDEKLFLSPYAVNNDYFISQYSSIASGHDKITILFVGKFIEKKRPMDLLEAYHRLKKKYSKIELIFVGDGILRGRLENYVKKYALSGVSFSGFVGQSDISKYYKMADIFVLPSGPGETWGVVVNEAMCFGLPVIVSDMVGSSPDLVKNGENGYIYPVGNIEKLEQHLQELISNGSKREKFGEKSLEIVRNYSYEKDVNGILESISKTI